MKKARKLIVAVALFGIIASIGAVWAQKGAATDQSDPPSREKEIVVSFTEYEWWLTQWEDNQAVCDIHIENDGIPTPYDVLLACGQTLYEAWWNTPPCPAAAEGIGNTQSCEGLYLFFYAAYPRERTILVELPVASVWLSLSGCTPSPPVSQCDEIPALEFSGEEPLPNEQITAIHVRVRGKSFDCPGAVCIVPVEPTGFSGTDVEFWGDSSFGDETEHFTARVRIVDGGVSTVPGENVWLVDVLSSQWRGAEFSSCAATWEVFPPVGGLPQWLSTPDQPEDLASDTPLVFLAGQMISSGIVDASACPQEGLLSNGAANTCGMELARGSVSAWQNQFDAAILQTANDLKIPAQLLKNLFAQESQFWPGRILAHEFGLGQLTELGADTTLLWNPSFYNQFCPLVLETSECEKGYPHLGAENQALLRGSLAAQTDASCPDCEMGIDLSHSQTTIDLFAQTLLANCEQVAYIVNDVTSLPPGRASSYEDLWRYTLVNYNAGPGCLITALQSTWRDSRNLNWESVSDHVSEGCQGALSYVERVSQVRSLATPDFLPTPAANQGAVSPLFQNPYPVPAGTNPAYP